MDLLALAVPRGSDQGLRGGGQACLLRCATALPSACATLASVLILRMRCCRAEKPIATDIPETIEAINACNEAGVKLMTALQRRFDPNFSRVKRSIAEAQD